MRPSTHFRFPLIVGVFCLTIACLTESHSTAAIRVNLTDGSTLLVDHVTAEPERSRVSVTIQRHGMTLTRHVPFSQISSVRYEAAERREDADAQYVSTMRPVAESGLPTRTTREKRCSPKSCSINSRLMYPPLPVQSRVIGVRIDPLDAYRDEVKKYFPNGVPISESGVALDLMRAAKEKQIFGADERGDADKVLPLPPPPAKRDAIRTLDVAVRPISSTGRVDWDTLRVIVHGADANGRATPVHGTLRITLWGRRQRLVHSYGEHFVGDPGRVIRLGSWTRSINSLGNGSPVSVELPLTRPLPDHDWRTAAVGDLHVQLLAPGQGVLETVREDVLLRHAGSLRERRIVETGSPFPSHAMTTGRRMPAGIRFFSPSSLGPSGRVLAVQP
jgi:hypothetical protein